MRHPLRDTWPAYLVLLVSLAVTAFCTLAVNRFSELRTERFFEEEVGAVRRAIDRRMASYGDLLLGARGLFIANDGVTRADWHAFARSLDLRDRYPGMQGIGYAERMTPAGGPALEARMRAQGQASFRVHPWQPAVERYPIVYLEPEDARNRVALGFDMFSEPTRREAMSRSRDSGLPALSGRVTLVQEITPDKQSGFLLYVPVYKGDMSPATVDERRRAIQGFVYSPFRAGDLFQGVLEGRVRSDLDFALYDGDEAPGNLLYTDRSWPTGRDQPRLVRTETISIGGRTLTLKAWTPLGLQLDTDDRLPVWVLLGGLFASLLLFSNTWALATAKRRAQARAEEMTAELRQADRAKDEFLSVISHELRTPLNFIMGFGSVLDDEIAGPLTAPQHEYMRKILGGAERMLSLVNDLLDFAKISAGKLDLHPAPTNYSWLVAEVASEMQPLADQKRLQLETDVAVPHPVTLDSARVHQALANLVSNAIKFTPEGGAVRVHAFERNGDVITEVTDTGIGISARDQQLIFTRFQQADMSATRQAGGTGLGLSITKALIEAHHGQIGVESEPGRGARFWFSLPRSGP